MWAGFQTEIAHFFVFCGLFLIQVCGCWLEEARLLIVSVPSCLIFLLILSKYGFSLNCGIVIIRLK